MIGDTQHYRHSTRRGTIVPMVALSLVVLLLALALVLDELWLDAAQVELRSAAEAAALGAVTELASDDLIRANPPKLRRLERAELAAKNVAARNRVADQSVRLSTGSSINFPDGDVHFGNISYSVETGSRRFTHSTTPSAVVVVARCLRSRNNPVALLFRDFSGVYSADLQAQSVATMNNQICGVRAGAGFHVPAIPLGILLADKSGQMTQTWETAIERRLGADNWSYDEATHNIRGEGDGIPEIVLQAFGDPADGKTNAGMLFVNPQDNRECLCRQVREGWSLADLSTGSGEWRLTSSSQVLPAMFQIPGDVGSALQELAGECRIILLYMPNQNEKGESNNQSVRCVGFAAGRVLHVNGAGGSGCELVFQPGVIATHAAVLSDEANGSTGTDTRASTGNPYIYRLQLTYLDSW